MSCINFDFFYILHQMVFNFFDRTDFFLKSDLFNLETLR
jgi:hypothetical protein